MIKKITKGVLAAAYLLAHGWLAVNWAGQGGMPGAFMSWGAGARSLGMGKAFVSIADDASATYWNPSGLAHLDRSELTALHSVLWGGTVYDFISYVHPTSFGGTFGFSGTRLFLGGFEGRDAKNRITRDFEDARSAYGVSYGQKIMETLSAGATLKKMSHTLDDHKSGSYIIDMGAMYSPIENLSVGLNLQNLLAVTYGTGEDLPMVIRMGMSYKLLRERLTLGLDVKSAIGWDSGMPFHVGGEYWAMDFLALRMGMDPDEFSMGFGLRYDDYGLDYAYASHDLGGSHRLSATINFGTSVRDIKEKTAREFEVEGDAAYRAGLFNEALSLYEKAYSMNPEDREIARKLNIMTRIARIVPRRDDGRKDSQLLRRGLREYIENNNEEVLLLALNYIISRNPDDRSSIRLLQQIGEIEGIEDPLIGVPEGVTLVDYKLHVALQLFYDSQYAEAIKELQDVLVVEPDNALAYKRLGSCFLSLGNRERAIDAWEKSLQFNPADTELELFLRELTRVDERDFTEEEILEGIIDEQD